MSEWYVAGLDGVTNGPYSTYAIIEGVRAAQISRDVYVAAVGDPQWTPLMTVPEIARGLDTDSRRPPGPPPRASKPTSPSNAPPSPLLAFVEAPSAPTPQPLVAETKPGPKVEVKPEIKEEKPAIKEEKKPPQLDPKYRKLPWMIFGAFAFVSIVLAVIAILRTPEKETYGSRAHGTANFQPSEPPFTSSRVGEGRVST